MPNTPATQNRHPATARQINYLKALANRTGTSFTYPHSSSDASAEIRRLKQITNRGTSFAEMESRAPAPAASNVQDFEIEGYGSSATWA